MLIVQKVSKHLIKTLLSLELTCNSSDMFSGCVAFSDLLGKDTSLDECSQCSVSPGEVGGMSDPLAKVRVVVRTVTSGEFHFN